MAQKLVKRINKTILIVDTSKGNTYNNLFGDFFFIISFFKKSFFFLLFYFVIFLIIPYIFDFVLNNLLAK
jgi:hypothetical protein